MKKHYSDKNVHSSIHKISDLSHVSQIQIQEYKYTRVEPSISNHLKVHFAVWGSILIKQNKITTIWTSKDIAKESQIT